ncbi:MAG: hypothetical protein WKF96_00140 [Solirubrobacteraceae bacterium]
MTLLIILSVIAWFCGALVGWALCAVAKPPESAHRPPQARDARRP